MTIATAASLLAALNGKRYATVTEAAHFSGLSEKTIRRLLARRSLKAYRPVAGRIVVSLQELEAVIEGSAGAAGSRGLNLHEAV